MKLIDRRRFLFSTGLIAGGTVATGLSLPGSAFAAGQFENDVFALVSGYGDCTSICRSGETVVFEVRIRSHQALAESVSRADLGPVRAEGNTLSFTRGTTVVHLRHTA